MRKRIYESRTFTAKSPQKGRFACSLALLLACACACALILASGCRLADITGTATRGQVACRQLTQRGASAIDRGDWAEAETLLAQASKTCDIDPDARRYYAEVLWHRGAQNEALEHLTRASELAPEDSSIRVRLASMRLELGQIDAASVEAEQAVRLAVTSPAAWTVKGHVARKRGNARDALADYHRALSYDANWSPALVGLAEVYLDLGQPQRALANVQNLTTRSTPGDEPPHVLYLAGLAYTGLGRYDEALEALSAAATRGPASVDVLYQLAEAQWRVGQGSLAQQTAQQVLAMAPQHVATHQLLARLAQAPPAAQNGVHR